MRVFSVIASVAKQSSLLCLTKVVPQDGTETIEYQYDDRGNVSKIACNDTDGYACLTTLDYNDKNECIGVDAVYSKNGNVITEEEYLFR